MISSHARYLRAQLHEPTSSSVPGREAEHVTQLRDTEIQSEICVPGSSVMLQYTQAYFKAGLILRQLLEAP